MASLQQLGLKNLNYTLHQGLFSPRPRLALNKRTKHFLCSHKPIPPKCSSVSSSLAPRILEETHKHMEDDRPLNEIWREIQGCNNWEDLLDPMNSHLRREIIRYGEFAQACYDSFDFDPHSKYCGTCKYLGAHFFEKLDMANRGYCVSRYLYGKSVPPVFMNKKFGKIHGASSLLQSPEPTSGEPSSPIAFSAPFHKWIFKRSAWFVPLPS